MDTKTVKAEIAAYVESNLNVWLPRTDPNRTRPLGINQVI